MAGELSRNPIFTPDRERIARSQLTEFVRYCESMTGRRFPHHEAFSSFSVTEFRRFWRLFLDWSDLRWTGDATNVCVGDGCEQAVFFPDVSLNYPDNLLRIDDRAHGDQPALTAVRAQGAVERLSRRELRDRVARLRVGLARRGIGCGDRVAAVAYNNSEAVIASLAVLSLGATFSAVAPDMGTSVVLSRFSQLAPGLLFCNLRSLDLGRPALLAERVRDIIASLPSLRAVIALDDGPVPDGITVPVIRLGDAMDEPGADGAWPRFPFNHPLFILFSSGTTGTPKCIVHGAGGTLLEHVKEHRLHCDLRPGDKMYFHTSCAWMMWNWQLSALASGTEIVLYDGPINAPDTLWALVDAENVTVFGTSPPYLQMCRDTGFLPRDHFDLSALRSILSTGSILYDWQYDWVHDHVKPLPLQSISGGTDIIGCFVLGNPNLPVYRGELQCRSLGYDVQAQLSANSPPGCRVGEVICRNPFPSRPLGLYGDLEGRRFHETYFSQNPGVWSHGDFIEFTERGTARLHGRSDGVLNIRGIRIGPAEIYRILQDIPEIKEALAVEQRTPCSAGGSRMVLLVVLHGSIALDGSLSRRIKTELGRRGSPAHVPEVIAQIDALPTTHSGKPSERAVHDAINDVPLTNLQALKNPECLEQIRQHPALHWPAAEDKALASVEAPSADAPLEDYLRNVWERIFEVSPIGLDDNFFDLGGHSLLAFIALSEVRKITGGEIPLSILLYAPTIRSLAALLREQRKAQFSCLVPIKAQGTGRPLFIVHGLYGNVLELKRLANLLRSPRPIYAFQALGLDPDQPPHQRVEDMAAHYIGEMRVIQPYGPFALAGHSFGGEVAFEMARRLYAGGEEVELLALFDSDVNERCLSVGAWLTFQAKRIVRVTRKALSLSGSNGLAYLWKVTSNGWLDATGRSQPAHPLAARIGGDVPAHFRAVHAGAMSAFRRYRPKYYPGRISFFRAEVREPQRCGPLPVWRRVSAGIDVFPVTGEHLTMMHDPHVKVLAEQLDRCLERGTTMPADSVVDRPQIQAAQT